RDYTRTLDLEDARAMVTYRRGDNLIRQEVFTDYANDITWVRLTSRRKRGINISVTLTRKENATTTAGRDYIIMTGQLPSGDAPGMKFAAMLQVGTDGRISRRGQHLEITKASECIIRTSAATNYDVETAALSDLDVLNRVR